MACRFAPSWPAASPLAGVSRPALGPGVKVRAPCTSPSRRSCRKGPLAPAAPAVHRVKADAEVGRRLARVHVLVERRGRRRHARNFSVSVRRQPRRVRPKLYQSVLLTGTRGAKRISNVSPRRRLARSASSKMPFEPGPLLLKVLDTPADQASHFSGVQQRSHGPRVRLRGVARSNAR
jgi:hypothetical protein